VRGRQRLPVHLPGQQHFTGHGFAQPDGPAVGLRGIGDLGHIRGSEGDMRGSGQGASGLQDLGEADAGPLGR